MANVMQLIRHDASGTYGPSDYCSHKPETPETAMTQSVLSLLKKIGQIPSQGGSLRGNVHRSKPISIKLQEE